MALMLPSVSVPFLSVFVKQNQHSSLQTVTYVHVVLLPVNDRSRFLCPVHTCGQNDRIASNFFTCT